MYKTHGVNVYSPWQKKKKKKEKLEPIFNVSVKFNTPNDYLIINLYQLLFLSINRVSYIFFISERFCQISRIFFLKSINVVRCNVVYKRFK